MKLAGEIPTPDKVPPRIVLITDACSKDATRRAEESGVEVLRVGTAAGNLAITVLHRAAEQGRSGQVRGPGGSAKPG